MLPKNEIIKTSTLACYDPKEETTLQTDASDYGHGATLLQNGKFIMYVSRALQQHERGYIAVEKEALTTAYTVERFHHFLCLAFYPHDRPKTFGNHPLPCVWLHHEIYKREMKCPCWLHVLSPISTTHDRHQCTPHIYQLYHTTHDSKWLTTWGGIWSNI